MQATRKSLVVAVPELSTYQSHTGIGRVFQSLCAYWGEHVQPINAEVQAHWLPILRNFPFRLSVPDESDIVLFPRTTGAQALRDTQGCPSIAVVHDIGAVEYPPIDQKTMDPLTYLSILKGFYGICHANHIIADSAFTAQRVQRRLPEVAKKITVIHLGVDPLFLHHHGDRERARNTVAQQIAQSPGNPLLVYVGTEAPRKNIPLLLQVFRRIKTIYPDAQLLKVGGASRTSWRKQTLQILDQLGLVAGKDVVFSGRIDDEMLVDMYCAADVFVSTSLYEGFGLPALEAMAVGTTVVVTNRGSFPEVVGQNGWVVEPEENLFVQAIQDALHDPLHTELSRRGRARAATFTWAKAAEQYLDIMYRDSRCIA